MKKILGVIGTRPQVIKADNKLCSVWVNTGQHYDDNMAGKHFRDKKIKPKYNLGLDSDNRGKMLDSLAPIMAKERPDIVVVYGDTFSTLAGAEAAAFAGIPVAHVESGLRSFDRTMPEEICRVLVDHLATWKFCPIPEAYHNLISEGIGGNSYVVGDPLLDTITPFLPLKRMKGYQEFVFCSIHRRENLNERNLREIMDGLSRIPRPVIMSLHPHTRRILNKYRIKIPKNVEAVKPMSHKDTLIHLSNCRYVITDSGGVQREAYWMTKHSYVIRPTTEWVNILNAGWSTLLPANGKRIAEAVELKREPSDIPNISQLVGADGRIRKILHAA